MDRLDLGNDPMKGTETADNSTGQLSILTDLKCKCNGIGNVSDAHSCMGTQHDRYSPLNVCIDDST